MPFKSQAQRSFMYAKHPAIAKRWSKEFPNQGKLPKHAKASKAKAKSDMKKIAAGLRVVTK